jgi:hypothetical protein
MSNRKQEPTEADGPLFREAYERAGQLDEAAPGTGDRKRAWGRFLRAAAAALAEGFLRDAFEWGAVLLSVLAAVFGATAGDILWAVPMVVAGVGGAVLVFWAVYRKWPFGKQWSVLLGVMLVQIVLIVALWQTH